MKSNNSTTKGGHVSPLLKCMFEGKTFETNQQFLTEAELRVLLNIQDRAGELFLEISAPWKDERVKDHEPVDLARPGLEQFYIRKPLFYIINGVRYETNSQYIRGKKIRHQAGIPPDHDIFLVVERPWEDELIDDDDWVNLARPGVEAFVSKPVDRKVTIFVNLKAKEWNKHKITFEEVVKEAYGSYDPNPLIKYSVTYKHGPKQNPDGLMVEGQTLLVKNKMTFHVSRTDQS